MKNIITILILCLTISCTNTNRNTKSLKLIDSVQISDDEFPDGEYCAEIEYYNPNTGTHSTYTLPVEVENGELVKILWNNGGWLDESHFMPPDISDGTASFVSNQGYEYTIRLLEQGSNCSSAYHNSERSQNNNSYIPEEEEDTSNTYNSEEDSNEEEEENEY